MNHSFQIINSEQDCIKLSGRRYFLNASSFDFLSFCKIHDAWVFIDDIFLFIQYLDRISLDILQSFGHLCKFDEIVSCLIHRCALVLYCNEAHKDLKIIIERNCKLLKLVDCSSFNSIIEVLESIALIKISESFNWGHFNYECSWIWTLWENLPQWSFKSSGW